MFLQFLLIYMKSTAFHMLGNVPEDSNTEW